MANQPGNPHSHPSSSAPDAEPICGGSAGPGPVVRVDPQAVARLRQLQEPGLPDLATEFIDLYVSDGQRLVAQLGDNLTALDREQLRRNAHTLKGSSRSMGAESVADLAGEIEQGVAQLDPAALVELVRSLERAFAATVPALEALKQATDSD